MIRRPLTNTDEHMLAKVRIAARGFVLSAEEKNRMRKNISAFMRARPVSGADPYRSIRWFNFSLFSSGRSLAAAGVLGVILMGSVSYAAEGALPGEPLYSVKLNVNEQVQRMIALTPKAQANWEATAAERRLTEVETLAKTGKLNPELKAQIKKTFETHAEAAKNKIAQLTSRQDANAAANIGSNFESSLRAHEKILTQLEDRNDASTSILASVKVKTATIAQERQDAEDTISAKTPEELKNTLEKSQQNAEYEVAKIRTLFTSSAKNFSATSSAKINTQLKGAESRIAKGRQEAGQSGYRDALKLFQQAIRTANETRILLQASGQFSIDLGKDLPDTDADDMTSTASTSPPAPPPPTATTSPATTTPAKMIQKRGTQIRLGF